jgi:hypothetical protein
MNDADDQSAEQHKLLAVYLRDHFAGANAGVALARRCREANADNGVGDVLARIADEIAEDRRALQTIMSTLGVTPSVVKSTIGSLAEAIGRLKGNGRIFRRSPSSTVVELEGLAAGIVTKRNLWRALRLAAESQPVLDTAVLDTLIERATSQFERVGEAHAAAARTAFAGVPLVLDA